jgi:SAM-dependent methyltransferase
MWFFEHLRDGTPVMREALRVLRPGGTITCVETDYATFKVWPQNPDWDVLERAQYEHFRARGDAHAGRALAPRLAAAGFAEVRATLIPFHFTASHHREALRRHVEYIAGFLGPAVPGLATLGFDRGALLRGVEFLRTLWQNPGASVTNVIYRVRAGKPA